MFCDVLKFSYELYYIEHIPSKSFFIDLTADYPSGSEVLLEEAPGGLAPDVNDTSGAPLVRRHSDDR